MRPKFQSNLLIPNFQFHQQFQSSKSPYCYLKIKYHQIKISNFHPKNISSTELEPNLTTLIFKIIPLQLSNENLKHLLLRKRKRKRKHCSTSSKSKRRRNHRRIAPHSTRSRRERCSIIPLVDGRVITHARVARHSCNLDATRLVPPPRLLAAETADILTVRRPASSARRHPRRRSLIPTNEFRATSPKISPESSSLVRACVRACVVAPLSGTGSVDKSLLDRSYSRGLGGRKRERERERFTLVLWSETKA